MKHKQIHISYSLYGLLLFLALMMSGVWLFGQDEEAKAPEKQSARLSLTYLNINNLGPRLIATVKTKVDRSYETVQGVSVDFYFSEKNLDQKLGTAVTNQKGEAILLLPETMRKTLDTLNQFTYLAAIEDNDRFEDEDEEIEIWRSHIALELEQEDSMKWVRFFVSEPDSAGNLVGVEDVNAVIYVQRLFGLLPVSEAFESTDEQGYLEVEFPNDVPGDEEGKLTIIAKVDDHYKFGSLRISKVIDWGVAKPGNEDQLSGQLWSSRANAPLYLIIVINLIVLGIWGTIAYIISQIFRIKRLGASS